APDERPRRGPSASAAVVCRSVVSTGMASPGVVPASGRMVQRLAERSDASNRSAMPAELPPARPPRLARLEVHGFKSFANRTRFVFLPGITAVVGPNGSGKSNVADAIRWVLGEQGSGALRAKKTDDVIFAGGQGRAPASVAEATLVF